MVESIDHLELMSLSPTGIQDYFDTGQSEASSVSWSERNLAYDFKSSCYMTTNLPALYRRWQTYSEEEAWKDKSSSVDL
jgi:hypothetical protein